MKESRLTRNIIKELNKEVGGFWTKIHGSAYQQAGLPDIIGCVDGQFYGLEVKVPQRRDTVTKLQQRTLDKLEEENAIVAVVTSPQEAVDVCLQE